MVDLLREHAAHDGAAMLQRDGRVVRGELSGAAEQPAELGARLAEQLLQAGGRALLVGFGAGLSYAALTATLPAA